MTQIDEVLVCGVWGETSDVEICPGQRLSLLGCHPPGVRGWRPASSSSSIVARGEGRGDARQKMTWSSIPNTGIEVRGGETNRISPGPRAQHLLAQARLDWHLG